MKTQPRTNGAGFNYSKRLNGVKDFNHTPAKKQSMHDSETTSRCRCKGDDGSPSSRGINITDGMHDAEDLRRDLSAIDLLRRYQRRMRSGYCRRCANEYIRAFFTKLDLIDSKGGLRERK